MPTKAEWAQMAAETLKEAQYWASAHPWDVVKRGGSYYVIEGEHSIFQHKSIWKVRDWVLKRIPWAKPTPWTPGQPSQKIQEHYANLCIPNHQPDTEDYSLTPEEKSEIHEGVVAKITAAAETLTEIVERPYSFFFTMEPTPSFVLADEEGNVIKESDSPWAIANHYYRITPESVV